MSQLDPAIDAERRPSEFLWYLGNNACYFLNIGIGMVMTPYIVTRVLNAPPELVGTTQAVIMLPLLVLLLFGGAKADRSDLRSWMMKVHLLQLLPPTMLAVLLYTDSLTLPLLIFYGVCAASLGSFAGPTRDSLLTRVADSSHPGGIQRAVGFAIGAQTVAQFIGITFAGFADSIGIAALPTLITINFLIAFALISRLSPAPPTNQPDATERAMARFHTQLGDIKEGLVEVWGMSRIRPVMLQMFFGSLLFMGSIMVLMPVMIRDIYDGDAMDFSLVFLCLFGGIGISATTLAQRPIKHQGKVLMIAMSAGGIAMVFIHFGPPLWALYLAVFFWGLVGGVTNAMSRTIVQSSAPPSHRARSLSIFQAAQLAGGPIGSFAMGYLIGWLGPLDAALVPAGLLVIVWLGLFFFTGLWHIQSTDRPSTEVPAGPPET